MFLSPHATKTFRIITLKKKMCLSRKELINFRRQSTQQAKSFSSPSPSTNFPLQSQLPRWINWEEHELNNQGFGEEAAHRVFHILVLLDLVIICTSEFSGTFGWWQSLCSPAPGAERPGKLAVGLLSQTFYLEPSIRSS